MSNLDLELRALKDNLCDMLFLVKTQMEKCQKAFENKDIELAQEVIESERKINIQEIAIDRDCENILALYTPVATDLRFVLATLKITNDLERIGDNAKSVAKFIKSHMNKLPDKVLKEYNLEGMLEILIDMLKNMGDALQRSDTKLAKKTSKKDKLLNECHKEAFKTTSELVIEYPHDVRALLHLFTIARNLERAGDLTKNIAEEIVFHLEAKVLKHQKDK
jgi:phosphate transport system protein